MWNPLNALNEKTSFSSALPTYYYCVGVFWCHNNIDAERKPDSLFSLSYFVSSRYSLWGVQFLLSFAFSAESSCNLEHDSRGLILSHCKSDALCDYMCIAVDLLRSCLLLLLNFVLYTHRKWSTRYHSYATFTALSLEWCTGSNETNTQRQK